MQADPLNYSDLIDQAMRGVVRESLKVVQKQGLPKDHHFYITFRTDHPATRISPAIKSRYPQEMTIVLQHQFWDFRVEEQAFFVTLSFGGVPEKLEIPFAALTAFADPSVKFGLQFQLPAQEAGEQPFAPLAQENERPADEDDDGAAEIISLDAFRKK